MLKDIDITKLEKDKKINNLFINANLSKLSINCNILKSNFFSDSFYFFQLQTITKPFLIYTLETQVI